MKDFIVDHTAQRLRYFEDDDTNRLNEKMRELLKKWETENQELGIFALGSFAKPAVPGYDLKRNEIQKTLVFPSPPNPIKQESYQSVFEVHEPLTHLTKKLHIEDYLKFRSLFGDVKKYRLSNLLPQSPRYPVSEPVFPPFPDMMITGPRELPAPPKGGSTDWLEKQKWQTELLNSWLSELATDRRLYYEWRKAEFDKKAGLIKKEWDKARLQWERAVVSDIEKYRELHSGYDSGKSAEVALYFQEQLKAISLLPCCEKEYETEFEEQEGILLINFKLPYVRNLEITKTKQLVSGPKVVPASKKEARDIVNQLPFLLLMRIIWEVPQVDDQHKVRLIACNGYIVYDDPATGNVRQDIILTIVAKPEELQQIRLEKVDPEVSFRALKGIAAAKIVDLVPVKPLIQFNTHDSRFITAKEIIDHLGDINLATMDWQDFEHLIRELFEKEFGQAGAEVKVTQASRDRGVDAIAFDPDPLRGGKFVIQAKRYTNTVDVSAVRDLYGTVLNEGANRGILVTTSNYGRDAYDFAKDKPLTLLNGANLIHLLEKHGYNVRIDLKEAKRLMNELSRGTL